MSAQGGGGYADLRAIKKRLSMEDSFPATDAKIQEHMAEADNYVNTQIKLHAMVPIENPDKEIISLASSLAATLYNYWQTPAKDRTEKGVQEWKNFVQDYILSTYGRKNPSLLAGGENYGTTSAMRGNGQSN